MGLPSKSFRLPPPRIPHIFPFILLISLFPLAALILHKVDGVISQTKTVVGHNLKPTPWHIFPLKTFDEEETRQARVYKILQCSYLTCRYRSDTTYQRRRFVKASSETAENCPEFFGAIHRDLQPWAETRISKAHLEAAQKYAAFRVIIVEGKLYVDLYYACVQSRAMFTIWALLQLLRRYPGMVPDVDMMFDCMDKPTISRRQHQSMPLPLFRYCTSKNHFDIPFPDWSFWGWPEINIGPWNEEFADIKEGSQTLSWRKKVPRAYWKGNPDVSSPIRTKLLKCNHSRIWGAQIFRQDWGEAARSGFQQSKLSSQCNHRYKIYAEGYAWSVSLKYILSCGSVALIISPRYEDFFSRGLIPQENFLLIDPLHICPAIKQAVDWGNEHEIEAEAIGRRGQELMESLSMDRVYDYMFHLISEYSKLQDFKPARPSTAMEACVESVLCFADEKQIDLMGSYRVCMCFQRRFKVEEAVPPEELRELFKKYAEGGAHMTTEQLHSFLVDVQGESGDIDARQIVELVMQKRHHITKFVRHTLTIDDFHHYLFSTELNPPIGSQVHQDMTAPLSQYLIFTGHNSYLTGNQLSSECSDVPIIKALNRGVRVVELDIWPNSTKDDVHVLHGRTSTTPVELIKCLRSIKEHAFAASPYPVVITLEDHLTPDLQAKVAQMLTNTFGDMLFRPESENFKAFPSPEELKHRILISTKPPKEYLQAGSADVSMKRPQKSKDFDEDESRMEPSDVTKDQNEDDIDDPDMIGSEDDESNDDYAPELCSSVSSYKSLIALHAGKPKGGLKEALKIETDSVRRLSLSEQALEKAAESHGTDVVRFTQKNFLRVYPKGTRFNSSNYKPLVGWMHGAQMVAFNMQGYGKYLWLMQGMFRSNGGCGYVKKPDLLMKEGPDNEIFNPKSEMSVKKTLKVKVYMGDGWRMDFKQTHFDTYSPPDFYVRVGIAGVPADEIMKKTEIKEDIWIPSWDKEFIFPLRVPELALLRVEVNEYDMSEKDDFAGQTCLPVFELKQGIRAVPLYNRKGEKYNSVRLLMRFEFV